MSDYMIGKPGGKDRYTVGWNESKSKAYKVGGGGSSVGQASNSKLGGGQLDPVVGSKSAFGYEGELDAKDIGDRGANLNLGGTIKDGLRPGITPGDVAENSMVYSEKGNFDDAQSAIARRKAQADSAARYYSKNGEFDSPVPQVDAPSKK